MKLTVADRINHLLKTRSPLAFTPLDVAVILQVNHNTVRRTLREMAKDGEAEIVGGIGSYRFPQPTVAEVNANA